VGVEKLVGRRWLQNLPAPEQDCEDATSACALGNREDLVALMRRLPPENYDVVKLYFLDRMSQDVIAKVLGVAQTTVSQRLWRAKRRMQFMRVYPIITHEQFQTELPILTAREREILWRVYESTSQTVVGKEYGIRPQTLRVMMNRYLGKIRHAREITRYWDKGEELDKYLTAFDLLRHHWNIYVHMKTGQRKLHDS
jgi:DNA-binding CsgD family transcriptional regulator